MMRPKSLVLLALALGCGLIASIGISQVLDGSNKPAPVETVPIYVAVENINLGDPLSDKIVTLEEWPKEKMPIGAITRWEDLEDRRPRTTVFKGEPILDSKLLAKGQINDPIQGVPSGMRLKTISVDARKAVAGLLSPGNRVDLQIFGRRRHSNGGPEVPFTKIFLQNIRVFAVDQAVEKSADGTESRTVAKTVSLVVTPTQANRITLAENLGEVTLIPRHPDDEQIVNDEEQDIETVFGFSEGNSREKESGASNDEPSGTLKSVIEKTVAAAVAPRTDATEFKMTIIYPNEVEQVRFSNGEPILTNGSRGNDGATNDAKAPVATPPIEPTSDDKATEDFPIDLNRK